MELQEITEKISAMELKLVELSEKPCYKGKADLIKSMNIKLENLKKRRRYKLKS